MTQQELAEITKARRAIQDLKESRISLRDYFAAAALTGLASRISDVHAGIIGFHAKTAYEYADAMLEKRKMQDSGENAGNIICSNGVRYRILVGQLEKLRKNYAAYRDSRPKQDGTRIGFSEWLDTLSHQTLTDTYLADPID